MAKRIAVIGGGAAGLMAALYAARSGASVTLFERNEKLGKKIYITGKGRCNITNNCDPETVLKNVPRNPRFLYSALSKCSPVDVMEYFEGLGVPLKTERGQRVFPVSDKAGDVVNALENQLRRLNVEIIRGNCTRLVIEDGRCAGALISGREVRARAVVLATAPGTPSRSRRGIPSRSARRRLSRWRPRSAG